jgi:hypothetical protein
VAPDRLEHRPGGGAQAAVGRECDIRGGVDAILDAAKRELTNEDIHEIEGSTR